MCFSVHIPLAYLAWLILSKNRRPLRLVWLPFCPGLRERMPLAAKMMTSDDM